MSAQEDILAALEQEGVAAVDISEHPVLRRYSDEEIEAAVVILEADQKVFVLWETDATPRTFSFSKLLPLPS